MSIYNISISILYSGVQTFMAFMLDEKPEWTQHRLKILIGSSAVYFLLALPMCSKVCVLQTSNKLSIYVLTFDMLQGGIHLFKVFDSRCSSSLLLLSLIEVYI